MAERKKPILLRRGPITGGVQALTNYRYIDDGAILKVLGNGKHDVTADYDALTLEHLLDPGAGNVTAALDGAITGQPLNKTERTSRGRMGASDPRPPSCSGSASRTRNATVASGFLGRVRAVPFGATKNTTRCITS